MENVATMHNGQNKTTEANMALYIRATSVSQSLTQLPQILWCVFADALHEAINIC